MIDGTNVHGRSVSQVELGLEVGNGVTGGAEGSDRDDTQQSLADVLLYFRLLDRFDSFQLTR